MKKTYSCNSDGQYTAVVERKEKHKNNTQMP